MYSPSVIQSRIEKLESVTGTPLVRYEIGDALDRLASIKVGDDGQPTGRLNKAQLEFIQNEQQLCRLDFRYWAERYGYIFLDSGGVGPAEFWTSQEIALRKLSEREKQAVEWEAEGKLAEGLLVVWHKARQLGATMFSRLLLMHRLSFYKDNRSMGASVDGDKVMELYDRDKLIYENMPFFLRPSIAYDVKGGHLYFDSTNGRILYQQAGQQSGMGTGRQFELSHLTELSSWPYAHNMVEMDFFPTIPQHRMAVCILESTANGRGNWWHTFSEDVRAGNRVNWTYVFVPWYVEENKYRRTPPTDWEPAKITQLHADKVWEVSPEFAGKHVRLSREKMYWYETERAAYQRNGTLNIFLSNWCAEPLQSFQHSGVSAFPPEFLETARLEAGMGQPYEWSVQ